MIRYCTRALLVLSLVGSAAVAVARAGSPAPVEGPLSPEESLRAIEVPPDYKVELAAAEPLVQDPVAIAWGADGRLWVVEMGDYPLGADGKGAPDGRVKFLDDTDGDGRYDKATVFLDGLLHPTAVMPWRDGALVAAAPDILFAKDADGDGKADERTVLYTGFGRGNQQHLVNGLRWGLDNWVYGANGDGGAGANGVVTSAKTKATLDIRGRDFRISPDDGGIDALTGPTQFGLNRDDWGNWFGSNNAQPMYHFVLDDRYVRRNPHYAVPDPRVHVVPSWNVPLFGIATPVTIRNPPVPADAPDSFASACSAVVYRDELLGPESAATALVCDPVTNLVHREILSPDGVTFTARRAAGEETGEFFRSADNWCRPSMAQTGPDGAVYVVDMYRHVIEHPQWIEKSLLDKMDVRAGADMGRIYRVYPKKASLRKTPRLDRLDTAGLVAALDHPNGWQRDTAQRLLVHKADEAAAPMLRKLAADSKRPAARLHALCTLDGLGLLDAATVRAALADAHPGVRRNAVRLCEPLLKGTPTIGDALAALAGDADAPVRLQLACTLGEWADPRAAEALAKLALGDRDDRYITAAVLTSLTPQNLEPFLLAVLDGGGGDTTAAAAATPALLQDLVRIAAAMGQESAVTTLLRRVVPPAADGRYTPLQFTTLAAVLDALESAGTSVEAVTGDSAGARALRDQVGAVTRAARTAARDAAAPDAVRVAAVSLMAREPSTRPQDVKDLVALLVPQSSQDVQSAAAAALARARDEQTPAVLLAGWRGYGPSLRAGVVDTLLGREEWVAPLLDALQARKVLPGDLDAARRQRLLTHADPAVRDRAAALLAETVNPDRQKVIDAYAAALTLKGDAAAGAQVFAKLCASCHRLGEAGNAVGPDLAALGNKSAESLLVHVLDPNRAVEARYTNYIAETRRGQTVSGIVVTETGSSVTLLGGDGKPHQILRTDLKRLRSTGTSLMPEGLETGLKPQDLADLFAHVLSAGPRAQHKTFPGNTQQVLMPAGPARPADRIRPVLPHGRWVTATSTASGSKPRRGSVGQRIR